jgi:hypothetical protein
VLKSALRAATNALLATLDHYTLEDLVRPRRALARLLEIAPNPRALIDKIDCRYVQGNGAAVEPGMISINHHGLALPEVPVGGVEDSG